MEKEFVTYQLALRMKELGFDEPCLGYYLCRNSAFGIDDLKITTEQIDLIRYDYASCVAPTFSQAFRWFRKNHNTHVEIHQTTDWEEDNESWSFVIFKYRLGDNDGMISSIIDYKTYEEAELSCLTKLIEIVESKSE